jgi:hypothetical protein
MWGTQNAVRVSTSAAGSGATVSQQLSRINYHRPETWSFFLAARILELPQPGGAFDVSVIVRFNLFFGVGRSVFDTRFDGSQNYPADGFADFRFEFPQVQPVTPRGPKYATRVLGPVLDEDAPDPEATRQPIEWFPAQDIQCVADVTLVGPPLAGRTTVVEVSAFFAPRSHMRPDWFAAENQFRGDETGGS